MPRLRYVSIFTGIGGFDRGFDAAGMECIAQIEIDKFCNRVLAARFPGVLRLKDVLDVRGGDFRSVNVVCFGSPCQDLSVAGRREGFEGSRSVLFFEAARIIGECKPDIAIWENVPGAFSSPKSHPGRDFHAVLVSLFQLGARQIGWRVVNARYTGVPQQRQRLFLVADFRGERAGQILYQSEACAGHPRASGEAGQDAGPATVGGIAERGEPAGYPEVARPLATRFRGDLEGDTYIPEVAYALADASGTRTGSGRDAQDTYIASLQHDLRESDMPTLRAESDGSHRPTVFAARIRYLTPLEQERCQGFPDGWTCLCEASGDTWTCRCPDGPRQRALGNAVPVTVTRWLGDRIVEALA